MDFSIVRENVIKWLNALESGNYPQGKSFLFAYDRYCCLGVAQKECDLRSTDSRTLSSFEQIGLLGPAGEPNRTHWIVTKFQCLTDLNDEGMSFRDIAQKIRSGMYFTNEFNDYLKEHPLELPKVQWSP